MASPGDVIVVVGNVWSISNHKASPFELLLPLTVAKNLLTKNCESLENFLKRHFEMGQLIPSLEIGNDVKYTLYLTNQKKLKINVDHTKSCTITIIGSN